MPGDMMIGLIVALLSNKLGLIMLILKKLVFNTVLNGCKSLLSHMFWNPYNILHVMIGSVTVDGIAFNSNAIWLI